MGLNWLSALVLLSGITPKLLVFGEGKRRGLICVMALSELSFYFQANRRPHDTLHKLQQCHGGTLGLCGAETLQRRWVSDGEIARA